MQAIGEQELPLVWKHQSGRKSLVIGNTAVAVVGKTPMRERADHPRPARLGDQRAVQPTATNGTSAIW